MLHEGTDLKHSSGWYIEEKAEGSPSPSGPLRASINLDCPNDHQASWLLPGKSFRIYSHTGGLIWGGLTVEPDRSDDGVTIHAQGIGSKLADWSSVYDPGSGEQPTFDPNDAVDYATAQGAPFARYGVDLSSAFGSDPLSFESDTPIIDILTLLQRAAYGHDSRVHVDSRGAITYRQDPTTPTWMMTPQSDYFGTADDVYLSLLRGYYLDKHSTVIRVAVTGGATGGTFILSGNGNNTSTIAFNATAGTMQTRIQSLGGIFASATVSLVATSDWLVDVSYEGAVLTLGNNSLSGGTNPGVSIKPDGARNIVKAEDPDAADKFGDKHGRMNLVGLGPLSEADAQVYIDGRFALVGGRMGWTTQVQLERANLFHVASGLFADPRHVEAGQMLQIPGIIDARSNPTTRGSIQWVIQEVEITEGPKPTAVVTPVGFVPRDFAGLLAPPENPATKEAA